MSRRRWTHAGFALSALVLVAVGATTIRNSLQYIEDSRWVAHSYAVLAQLETIASIQHRAILAQREYLLAGKVDDRNRYWRSSGELPARIEGLRAMVADSPVQLGRVGALDAALQRRLDMSSATLGIRDSRGLADAIVHLQGNNHEVVDEGIERLVRQIGDEEIRLLDQRRRHQESSARWLIASSAVGIPLGLAVIALVYLGLMRESRSRASAERGALQANAELSVALERSAVLGQNMASLGDFGRNLQSCTEAVEAYEMAHHALENLLPNLAGTIYILRASRDHAEAVAQWGQPRATSNSLPVPGDCWAMRRNQPHYVDNLHTQLKCAHVELPPPSKPTATACIPLSAQGETLGWQYLSGPGPGPLAGIDLALTASEQLSLALASLRLREHLRHQSIRDGLTGLFNRRYLEESLAREIARCQRRKLPLGVLLFDLDHFKAFNDRHGHAGGDALLTAFGRLVQANCRPEDIPCRYGGEEFTLILPEAGIEVVRERAERILAATAQLVVQHLGQPLSRVTTSIGVAIMPENGTAATTLMEAADKALYRAKAEGRNRFVLAESPPPA